MHNVTTRLFLNTNEYVILTNARENTFFRITFNLLSQSVEAMIHLQISSVLLQFLI